jgi:hypothetical protein
MESPLPFLPPIIHPRHPPFCGLVFGAILLGLQSFYFQYQVSLSLPASSRADAGSGSETET